MPLHTEHRGRSRDLTLARVGGRIEGRVQACGANRIKVYRFNPVILPFHAVAEASAGGAGMPNDAHGLAFFKPVLPESQMIYRSQYAFERGLRRVWEIHPPPRTEACR